MNEAIVDLLCQRVSFPRLAEPAPEAEALDKIYRAALRAPDHMLLRPWRYLVIQGEGREALGELLCEAGREQCGGYISTAQAEKYRAMPLRAPMILVGVSLNVDHPKVPAEEQVLSCGAGISYMLLALQAQGFGGIWRTGPLAQNPRLKSGLGIAPHESLVGFLYLGTPVGEAKPLPDLKAEDYFLDWPGSDQG